MRSIAWNAKHAARGAAPETAYRIYQRSIEGKKRVHELRFGPVVGGTRAATAAAAVAAAAAPARMSDAKARKQAWDEMQALPKASALARLRKQAATAKAKVRADREAVQLRERKARRSSEVSPFLKQLWGALGYRERPWTRLVEWVPQKLLCLYLDA